MKGHTPLRALISRHTRELLRRYQAGKLKALIATRQVEDRFVVLTPAERRVYEQVEDYIGSTYDNAAAEERTAVGFVMTIYRRRLASSFTALIRTLEGRLAAVGGQLPQRPSPTTEEDVPDDEQAEEEMDADQALDLEQQALALEELGDIRALLTAAKRLPHDTKAGVLLEVLRGLREQGYKQAMVFTQYTDTMDFLRGRIAEAFGPGVICFSGLDDLAVLLARPELLPPGIESKSLGSRDRSYLAPGMAAPVRVTTDPDYFEQHPDSTELWSPGSPLFPKPETVAEAEELVGFDWRGMVAMRVRA